MGVSRQAVSKWELDQSKPDTENIILMCDVLNIDTNYLLLGKMNQFENTYQKNYKQNDFKKIDTRFTWTISRSLFLAKLSICGIIVSLIFFYVIQSFHSFSNSVNNDIVLGFPDMQFDNPIFTIINVFYLMDGLLFVISLGTGLFAIKKYLHAKKNKQN